ncbi:MAG: MFS transporter [Chloroflexi bacterium]|nr:MAG: MFS transporter [Chloroflexota bacterium]
MTADTIVEDQKFQTDKVAVLSAGHSVQDTYQAFLPALLPILIEKFSLMKTEAGLLSVFSSFPSLLQPIIGYLADNVGPRYFVILAPAVSAIMMSLLGVAPTYIVAALLLIVAGISSASIHATGPVIAGRLSAQRLGMGMSFWMMGGEIGRVLGPLVIVSAVEYLKPQNTPWLAVGGVLTSVFLYFQLRNLNGRAFVHAAAPPWREALKSMRPVLLPVSAVLLLRAFAFVSVTTFLPTFLTEQGADLMMAGVSLSVMQAAGVAGAFLGGSLSDRLGRRPVLIAGMTLSAITLFAFTSLEGWVLFPLLLALGFCLLSITPIIMAIVQESFPDSRALANGVYMAVNFVSSSIVAVLIGAIGDLSSLRTAYYVSAALALASLPFILSLPRVKKA